jgi:hypothetical protein
LRVATCLSCRYLSVVSLLDHLCMPSMNLYIYVYGTCNRFLCMTYMFLYIFMCICCCGTSKSGKKKIWATIRRGQCRRRRDDHSVSDKPYAEGQAIGTGYPLRRRQCRRRIAPLRPPSRRHVSIYAEGKAVGVCPSWRLAWRLPWAAMPRASTPRVPRAVGIGPVRRGPPIRRGSARLRRGRSTPRRYADGCPRRIIRRRLCCIRRGSKAVGNVLDSCSLHWSHGNRVPYEPLANMSRTRSCPACN